MLFFLNFVMSVSGRVIVITGASSGIGKSIAEVCNL